MVDPKCMCLRHILGEHVECHMFVGTINNGISIRGYITKGLLEVHSLVSRHNELSQELIRRNCNHKSPLPEFKEWTEGYVDSNANLMELANRCPECKKLIEKNKEVSYNE